MVVITEAQIHSAKLETRFCADSFCSVSAHVLFERFAMMRACGNGLVGSKT